MTDIDPDQLSLLPTDDETTTEPRMTAIPPAVTYAPPRHEPMQLMCDDERAFWVAWNRVRGIGPARFGRLIEAFGDAATAWVATAKELRAAGLEEKLTGEVIRRREKIDPETELSRLERHSVVALTLRDAEYPRLLREIPLAPTILYVRGTLIPADDIAIAIVGTRRISAYGRQVTARLASELTERGMTIVSGLARGVDGVAHTAALDAGGRTIAVLGCGPDLVYPPEHAKLAERIAESGAVVSEFPVGVQPEASNFPARNRIISGLSSAILVTEAPENSGALITAQFAGEHGREIMAVPGNIYNRTSMGANKLIQDGALCVTKVEDIIEALNLHLLPQQLDMREMLPADETEATLLRLLDDEPHHVDDLCHASGLATAVVSSTMVMLELKGLVRHLGGMVYSRSR